MPPIKKNLLPKKKKKLGIPNQNSRKRWKVQSNEKGTKDVKLKVM